VGHPGHVWTDVYAGSIAWLALTADQRGRALGDRAGTVGSGGFIREFDVHRRSLEEVGVEG
jgi:hypothetical protein